MVEKAKLAGKNLKEQAVVDDLAEKATNLRAGLIEICHNPNFDSLRASYASSLDAKIRTWSNYLGMFCCLRTIFRNS